MVSRKTSLTLKQLQILSFIREEVAHSGRPPTYRDIAAHCGYEAVGTVQDHIRALIQKGFLEKEAGVARGIRLTHRSTSVDIPILGVVPAGKPIEAIESSLGTLSMPLQGGLRTSSTSGDLFALRVTGDSMIEAGIFEGDLIIVRKQSTANHGEIIVAMIDGEATVKTLERKGERVRLLPANARYSPIEISPESENLIQGKVIGLQRFYESGF